MPFFLRQPQYTWRGKMEALGSQLDQPLDIILSAHRPRSPGKVSLKEPPGKTASPAATMRLNNTTTAMSIPKTLPRIFRRRRRDDHVKVFHASSKPILPLPP